MQLTLTFFVVCTLCLSALATSASLIGRIAFGSCSNPRRGDDIWRKIQSFQPQHLVLLGDQIYADRTEHWGYRAPTPAVIENEYELLFNQQSFQELLQSVDSFSAVFDDHDFGPNNGDKTYVYRDDSIALFKRYYSNLAKFNSTLPAAEANDGVYSSKTIHISSLTIKIVLLDVRSNKDPAPTNLFSSQQTSGDFLGETQWAWLESELNDPNVDVFLVGSPIQVLPDDKALEECWGEFPQTRQRLLNTLVALAQRQDVFLLSGDIHSAEVSQVRCRAQGSKDAVDLVEFTSSGLTHSMVQTVTPSSAEAGSQGKEEVVVPAYHHAALLQWISSLYQVVYPGHYRPRKYADSYRFVNFALLDFVKQTGNGDSDSVSMVFKVLNHQGDMMIEKSYSLRKKRANNQRISVQQRGEDSVCEPIQGPVPAWRLVIMKTCLVVFLMVVVLFPALLLVYYAVMALYYICMGREYKRRAKIEQSYWENKYKQT